MLPFVGVPPQKMLGFVRLFLPFSGTAPPPLAQPFPPLQYRFEAFFLCSFFVRFVTLSGAESGEGSHPQKADFLLLRPCFVCPPVVQTEGIFTPSFALTRRHGVQFQRWRDAISSSGDESSGLNRSAEAPPAEASTPLRGIHHFYDWSTGCVRWNPFSLSSRAGCDELPTIRVHVLPCGSASRSPLQTQVSPESGENLPPCFTLPSI